MMDPSQRKEQFSRAYVRAIASVAGFAVSVPDVDNDSIDFELSGRIINGRPLRLKIDVQLKCTADDIVRDERIVFPLKRKNDDDLRSDDVLVPRLLVVVLVSRSEVEWLEHSEEQLILRRCGYWISLAGQPESTNTSTISVAIPRTNLFTVSALNDLMQRAAMRARL